MKRVTLSAVLAIAMLACASFATPSFAVDASISPLCRGDVAADHANFCAAVANNKSLASEPGKPAPGCPADEIDNPTPPPACIPAAV